MGALKLFLPAIILTAAVSSYAESLPEYKNVSNLSTGQGLSHYTANSFHTDRFGIVWTGTAYGLNKVVGTSVESFTRENSPGLCDNYISDLCGDLDGHIFILGAVGVSILDQRSETFTTVFPDRSDAIAYSSGGLFIANGTKVSRYDVAGKTLEEAVCIDSLKYGGKIQAMAVGTEGDYFLGTSDWLLKISAKGEIVTQVPISFPNGIMQDNKGYVWVSMRDDGICRLSPDGDVTHFKHDESEFSSNYNNVRSVVQTSPNTYYVGSFGGLSVLDPRTGEFREIRIYRKYHNDCSQSVRDLHYDGSGGLWIGSFYGGVFRHDLDGEEYSMRFLFDDSNGMPNRHILSASGDSSGNLWFCTSTSGLYRHDPSTSSTVRIEQFPALNTKSSLFDARCNTLWVGTVDEGVAGVDVSTGRVFHLPRYTSDGSTRVFNVLKIIPWGKDKILLATSKGVLKADTRGESVSRLCADIQTQIWDFIISGEDLWMVTNSGTVRFNLETSKYRIYDTYNHQCIHKDRFGRLWFGSTGRGLYMYDEVSDNFSSFSEGLPEKALYITAISDSPDPEILFVGTNSGLFRFDLNEETFSTALEDVMINEEGLLYDPDNRCNYVCSLNDAFSLARGGSSSQKHPRGIHLTDLYVGNARVRPGDDTGILSTSILYTDRLELKNNLKDISIRFSGPARLAYRMGPSDGAFKPVENDGRISFHVLKSGSYTLEVKESGTSESGDIFTLPIKVTPPFYRNPLIIGFFILLALGGLLAIILTYLRKMAFQVQLEKEKNEKENLEKFNRSKLDFFTNVSHEFKTPLTIIGGLSEMLVEKVPDDEEFTGICKSINESSSRLRRLIDELIDFRKKDRTSLCPYMAFGNLTAMCRRVFESFICYADKRGIKYSFDAQSPEMTTRFDSAQLEKVIFNILSNAFKFTRDTITMSLKEENGFFEISIWDNGCGIPENERRDLFEAFVTGSAKASGSGIGLAFSKDIVTEHNGTIEVDSKEGYWTLFTVKIPVNPGLVSIRQEEQPGLSADAYESEHDEVKGSSLLIIDDNPEVIRLLKMYFSEFYNIRCAPSAEEGIRICGEFVPNLIITDVMMDGLSGIDLCRHLKAHPQTSHIPIVLISADSNEETILEGLDAGADDYVTKPFSLKVLHSKCRKIIEFRQAAMDEYRTNPEVGVESLVEDSESVRLLKMAEEIVDANISNPVFSIPEFAKMMGLSRTYLFTKIKGITGLTPNDFIINRKLKQAAVGMISCPEKRISDIAYEYGFSAPSYFSKCFKDLFGMTPADYRKNNGGI